MTYPDKPFLNEFAVDIVEPLDADKVLGVLAAHGILGGVKLTDSCLLIAATEMCSPSDIKEYVELVKGIEK